MSEADADVEWNEREQAWVIKESARRPWTAPTMTASQDTPEQWAKLAQENERLRAENEELRNILTMAAEEHDDIMGELLKQMRRLTFCTARLTLVAPLMEDEGSPTAAHEQSLGPE